jgi:hypothetical protein
LILEAAPHRFRIMVDLNPDFAGCRESTNR